MPIPTPTILADGTEEVAGSKLTLRFTGKRCIHARRCVLGAPAVFKANVQGPWIDPDAMDVEALVAVAQSCPSGAITYTRRDSRPDETPPPVNLATIRENGPIAIHAELQLNGEPHGTRATLCRCGASKNKPYCDGSHTEAGFTATGEPAAKESVALAVRNGPLNVEPQPNGSLKVTGSLEIITGTGHTINRVERAFLCRCGQSKNKPYCDGSHKAAGFVAP
ncbi:MAG: CDGSH iron-sulfur domain-containing protein [bacterium]